MNTAGMVLWCSNNIYYVETKDKHVYKCIIKGKKIDTNGLDFINPICIGDTVSISPIDENNAQITSIEQRKNYFFRYFNKTGKIGKNLIASNLDQLVLVLCVDMPSIRTAFVDRIISICEIENITPIIIINKIDLGISEYVSFVIDTYKALEYKIYQCSVKENINIESIKDIFIDKKSLIVGQSGVGKSSLINGIFNNSLAQVGDISSKYNRGRHTTTMAKTYLYDKATYIIDSPGMKEFSYYPYDIINIAHSFREFKKYTCQFNNCSHTNENGCGVLKAIEKDDDEHLYYRYKNYLGILEDVKYKG